MSEQVEGGTPTTQAGTTNTRIQERRYMAQGFGGGYWQDRVRDLEPGEPLPDGVIVVDPATPVHDWQLAADQSA